MSEIKQGYDGKLTQIRIAKYGTGKDRKAEVWIEQEGVREVLLDGTDVGHSETLAYASLDELLALRDEINGVIQDLVA